jgi:hypothetical protein
MQVQHSVLSCSSMPMKLPIRASRWEPPRRNRQLPLPVHHISLYESQASCLALSLHEHEFARYSSDRICTTNTILISRMQPI